MPRIVAVTFDDRSGYGGNSSPRKHYHYLTNLDLQVGDKCVVNSPYGGDTIVTVRSLDPVNGIRHASKWIICKVDRSEYEARQQAEAELAALQQQLQVEITIAEERAHRARLVAVYPQLGDTLKRIEGLEATLGVFNGVTTVSLTS